MATSRWKSLILSSKTITAIFHCTSSDYYESPSASASLLLLLELQQKNIAFVITDKPQLLWAHNRSLLLSVNDLIDVILNHNLLVNQTIGFRKLNLKRNLIMILQCEWRQPGPKCFVRRQSLRLRDDDWAKYSSILFCDDSFSFYKNN